MSAAVRTETFLWLAQRVSAVVLAVCVSGHIVTMILAVQGGLSAAEIISRVGGSGLWLGFYLVFVGAVAVHAPIGLKSVLREMTSLPQRRIELLVGLFALLIAALGVRAAFGLYALGGS